MQSFTITRPDLFADGETVTIYRVSAGTATPASGVPAGTAAQSQVASGGTVVFTALPNKASYIAYAPPDRYVRFNTTQGRLQRAWTDGTNVYDSDGELVAILDAGQGLVDEQVARAAADAVLTAADAALQVELDALGTTTTPAKMVGINSSPSVRAVDADLEALGVGWSRVELWSDLDVSGTSLAAIQAAYAALDVRVFPLVNDYATAFTDHAAWIAAALAVAAATDSPVLEVGNEPWIGFFWGTISAAEIGEYAAMVRAVAIAVKDATGKGVLAATTPWYYLTAGGGREYKPDLLAGAPDLLDHIAGVTLHPYGQIPELGMGTTNEEIFSYYALGYTRSHYPGVGIYVTEVGQNLLETSGIYTPTLHQQANAARRYLKDLQEIPELKAMFWYRHCDFASLTEGWGLLADQNDETKRREAWYRWRDGSLRTGVGLENKIANPDAISGTTGWTAFNTGGGTVTLTQADSWEAMPYSPKALRVQSTGATGSEIDSDPIDTFPGQKWYFAAEVKGTFRNQGAALYIYWLNDVGAGLTATDGGPAVIAQGRLEFPDTGFGPGVVVAPFGAYSFKLAVYDQGTVSANADYLVTAIMAVPFDENGSFDRVRYFSPYNDPDLYPGTEVIPVCEITRSTNQTITSGAEPPLVFDTVRTDNAGMFNIAEPDCVTCVKAGRHRLDFQGSFANTGGGAGVGTRSFAVGVFPATGGVIYVGADARPAAGDFDATQITLSMPIWLLVGDKVKVIAYHTRGSNLDVLRANRYSPELQVAWERD